MSDLEALQSALANVPVRQFALEGTRNLAETLARIGDMNLRSRMGGGRWPRGVGSVNVKQSTGDSWYAELSSPFMGMEWGGYVTNIWGNKHGTNKSGAVGLKPMWAPWHREYKQGYILGAAFTEIGTSDAQQEMAEKVLNAYTQAFDQAGLKRG